MKNNIIELSPYVAELTVEYADIGRTKTSLHGTVEQVTGMLYGLVSDLLECNILTAREVRRIVIIAISDYKNAACQSGKISKQRDTER